MVKPRGTNGPGTDLLRMEPLIYIYLIRRETETDVLQGRPSKRTG